jgi:hypothetical protein
LVIWDGAQNIKPLLLRGSRGGIRLTIYELIQGHAQVVGYGDNGI